MLEECIQLPPHHISSKLNKAMNLGFYCFYYTVGWHFSPTWIYEGFCREFISGPTAFNFSTNLFAPADYLEICTFTIWHCLKSGPYLFLVFIVTSCVVFVVQLGWSESPLKKNTKSRKKWHAWTPSRSLVIHQ